MDPSPEQNSAQAQDGMLPGSVLVSTACQSLQLLWASGDFLGLQADSHASDTCVLIPWHLPHRLDGALAQVLLAFLMECTKQKLQVVEWARGTGMQFLEYATTWEPLSFP